VDRIKNSNLILLKTFWTMLKSSKKQLKLMVYRQTIDRRLIYKITDKDWNWIVMAFHKD
jgi:hypothetical protein